MMRLLKRVAQLPADATQAILKLVLLFIASVTGAVESAKKRLVPDVERAQMGVFMVLVMGSIALIVVSVVLLFGMDIAGSFAEGIDNSGTYSDAANQTENSTGDAFSLFATSTLVIPAAAVLAVLIGGLVGAISMRGTMPGMGGGGMRRRRRR